MEDLTAGERWQGAGWGEGGGSVVGVTWAVFESGAKNKTCRAARLRECTGADIHPEQRYTCAAVLSARTHMQPCGTL